MNKQDIQALMKIARPVIIAAFGRQPLKLVGYNLMDVHHNFFGEADRFGGWFDVKGRTATYRLQIERNAITCLRELSE